MIWYENYPGIIREYSNPRPVINGIDGKNYDIIEDYNGDHYFSFILYAVLLSHISSLKLLSVWPSGNSLKHLSEYFYNSCDYIPITPLNLCSKISISDF